MRHDIIVFSQKLFNSFVVKSVYIRTIFFSLRNKNVSATVVHLLEWPTLVLCSNPGHQTKGHHVPLGLCDDEGSSPALGGVPAPCLGSTFWGCGSSNLEPPTMGIAAAMDDRAEATPMVGGSRLDKPQPQKEEPETSHWWAIQRGA